MQLSFNEKKLDIFLDVSRLAEYAPLFTFRAVVKRTVYYNLKKKDLVKWKLTESKLTVTNIHDILQLLRISYNMRYKQNH